MVAKTKSQPADVVQLEQGEPLAQLYAALAKAQAAAESVGKDARNEHHRYAYASAEAVLIEAALLGEHGLALIPLAASWLQDGEWRTLRRVYRLTHRAGASVELVQDWPYREEKGRPWDKTHAAALTSSLAYQYRDLLRIPRVDQEDDIAGRDDREHQPAPAPEQTPKRPPLAVALREYLGRVDAAKTAEALAALVGERPHGLHRDPDKAAEIEHALALYEERARSALTGESWTVNDDETALLERLNALKGEP